MTEQEQQAFDAMRAALELAMDNLRPHGDNCFLHDEGEYNACFCGKDSLVDHLQSVVENAALIAADAVSIEPLTDSIQWIVNDLGELGVKAGNRFMFLYKGDSIEYGKDDIGTAKHGDGTPMKYRIVGKREFGEVCYPLKWIASNRIEPRYTEELVFTPGLSFGTPEDGEWRELPPAAP